MDRPNDRLFALVATCVAAVALSLGASCSGGGGPKSCQSDADCALGQVCNHGLCYINRVTPSGSSTGSGSGNGASSGAASTGGNGQSTGNGGSSSGASAGNGSSSSGTSAGQGGSSTTGAGCWPPPCGNGGSSSGGSSASSGQTGGSSSGGTVTVDQTGVSFVITGDTRPDSGGSYPQQVVNLIYTDFSSSSLSPEPLAAIATGDFQEATDSNLLSEIDDYEAAIKLFDPSMTKTFPSMGNHECISTSVGTDCAGGNTTAAYDAFMQMLVDMKLASSTSSLPYYTSPVISAPNGDTLKVIVTAAQAWDSNEASWFDSQLTATPTTFTLVARHEPDDAIGCQAGQQYYPCPYLTDVQTSIANHPGSVTLKVEGHTHELRFDDANDAIVSGGGGAPLQSPCTSSSTIYCGYGFIYCQERTDRTLLCTAYDATSGPVTAPPPRVVTANGTENYLN
ncbi:MAG: hypothetical protein ACYDCL_03735 [Myxococcales bacterium]